MRIPAALALAALLALPATAAAQDARPLYDYRNLAFQGFGGEVGWIFPARTERTLMIAGRADLGWLGPAVRIVPRIGFWASELKPSEVRRLADQIEEVCDRQTDCPAFDLGEVRVSDLMVGADAQYVWETELGLDTYVGLGTGVHLLNAQGDAIDETFVEEILDAIAPGVDLLAGVELPLGPLRVFGEARGVLAGNTRWIGLSVGGMVNLGAGPGGRRPGTPSTGAR